MISPDQPDPNVDVTEFGGRKLCNCAAAPVPHVHKEPRSSARPLFRQWVDDNHSISFRVWEDGTTEYATRTAPSKPWGDWMLLTEINVRTVASGD